MNKCDFCEMSSPKGKCFYSSQVAREDDCRKAISQMVKALGENNKNNRKRLYER